MFKHFLTIALLSCFYYSYAQMTTHVSQHGVTFTFDQPYQSGQYANGDYWVLGPVTIVSITPDFTPGRNGWEVNPDDTKNQGFDDRTQDYDASRVPSLPYTSGSGIESIVKAVSLVPEEGRKKLRTAVVLTVVNSIPLNNGTNSFRPPYFSNTWKPTISTNNLNLSLLPSYPSVPNTPSLAQIEDDFSRVHLDHKVYWTGRTMHPKENMPEYGSDICNHTTTGALRLMMDDPSSAKLQAAINYVQTGIDFYNMALNGVTWRSHGGHTLGRKLPITVAAVLLQDQQMKDNISIWAQAKNMFSEDEDFYFSQQADNGNGKVLFGQPDSEFNYWQSFIRLIGSKSASDPYGYIDGGRTPGGEYQFCCISKPYKALAIGLLMMPELECVWDNDQFVEYCDRWVNQGTWTQNDPCAPADLTDTNMDDYGVTYGPDGNGGCILDTDPSDGIGRFPNLHGSNADAGYYGLPYGESLWAAYRSTVQTGPCSNNPGCAINAGTGSTLMYCDSSLTGTIDLFNNLSGNPDLTGVWLDIDNSNQLNNSTVNLAQLSVGSFRFKYLVSNGQCSDSSEVMITVNDCSPPNPCFAVFTPVIDGQPDAGWNDFPGQNITHNIIGTVTDPTDLSGSFKMHWDAQNLYLLVEVQDDILMNDNSAWHIYDDCVSVYLDGGNENSTTYDGNDHKMQFRWNDPIIKNNGSLNPVGVVKGEFQTASGYSMEMLIPWSTIGYSPSIGHILGIDVHLNDDDDGGDRDKKLSWHDLQDLAWTNPSVLGDYMLDDPCIRTTCDLKVLLEGPYDAQTGMMTGNLLQMGLLPSGQPYTAAPWNYPGLEGAGWLPGDYPLDAVDWVLLSFRETVDPLTEIMRVATVVLADGTIPAFDVNLGNSLQSVYVMVEHRNHLPILSPQPIAISNNSLTFDFTAEDSYRSITGFGQKQNGAVWMMYGGNPDQIGLNSCDINSVDRIFWETANGTFGVYNAGDYDFDGDVNAADKVLFYPNNGIYSTIPK